ncbi:hypothetical protein K504DRAFT_506578 [Pleomassaria siparia CBS 279.74]|uniref:SMP domain-containing protein n=1 Tax=Pleomassaria siparia CBS 279.74 TaxID=1314801 RepID=A0A6G1JX38_9PLEO|nr:hypothetical protein K504DRAFT_506578 [Pleomassaria siparia CBS 279.74]
MSSAVASRPRALSSVKMPVLDFHDHLQVVLAKLERDPLTITTDDARRLHEHFDAKDERSARIISAVEALALANQDLRIEKGEMPTLGQPGHASLLTVVEDLLAAVDANPEDVTTEVLKLTQTAVSKCQKAIGTSKATHPELEAKLQEEFAKIEPKVEQGTVTREEADHLHSLEARTHGHTEKGGLTSIAQSVVAKRERKVSFSEGSNKVGLPTVEIPNHLHSVKACAHDHDHTKKVAITPSAAGKREGQNKDGLPAIEKLTVNDAKNKHGKGNSVAATEMSSGTAVEAN